MGMGKDLLKSIQGINNDTNLKQGEALALIRLVEYYNVGFGYAYPLYDDLKSAIKTTRSDTVSRALKGLVAKGYITIAKMGYNKNKYFIHKHLYFIQTNEKVESATQPIESVSATIQPKNEKVSVAATPKPIDSNGNKPIENQIHVDEVLDPKVIEITEYTGFNKNQSQELLNDSKGDKKTVITSFDYAKKMKNTSNPQEIFAYTKWAVNNHKKVLECQSKNNKKELKFNNFESREYDYENLEKKLLGWDDGQLSDDLSDYVVNDSISNFDIEQALKSM